MEGVELLDQMPSCLSVLTTSTVSFLGNVWRTKGLSNSSAVLSAEWRAWWQVTPSTPSAFVYKHKRSSLLLRLHLVCACVFRARVLCGVVCGYVWWCIRHEDISLSALRTIWTCPATGITVVRSTTPFRAHVYAHSSHVNKINK